MVLCGASSATTINVNTTTGIQNAINTAHNGDTLNLSAGTYNEYEITVDKNLTINGPTISSNSPPQAVIDANRYGRVFYVPSGVTVTMKYLLIQNGDGTYSSGQGGGGIYNLGAVKVISSTFYNNTAKYGGGIYNFGTLNVTSSKIFNNTAEYGGSICNGNPDYFSDPTAGGTVTLINSNIYNNGATSGGVINNLGILIVTGSNIYNSSSGDGISNGFYMGMLNSSPITVTGISSVTNSKIYNNGYGINNIVGMVTVTNSKVYNNIGCGLHNSDYLTVSNVMNSSFNNNDHGIRSYGNLTVIKSNIYNNRANGLSIYGNTVTVNSSNLFNNIGMGIYIDWSASKGYVDVINANIYQNSQGIYNYGTLQVTGSNIYNNSASNGGGIENYSTLTITNSTIHKNTAQNGGGGIYNHDQGIVTVNNSNIYDNFVSEGDGGGIYCGSHGTVNMINSKVYNNKANYVSRPTLDGEGGGIYNDYQSVCTMINSSICNNTASLGGGGIHNNAGTLNFTGSNIYNNTGKWGGGIFNDNYGSMIVTGTNLLNNTAYNYGGAISNTYGSNSILKYCRIIGNIANMSQGSSIYSYKGTLDNTGSVNASLNWWGSNNNPSSSIYDDGDVTYSPWLASDPTPTVVSSDPTNNAVNVATNKVIKITFSAPVKWGNFWIELKNSNGTTINITKTIIGNVLTITPLKLLAPGTEYNICLHTGCVNSYYGYQLAGKVISFTTDSTPPTVKNSDPSNNAVNVARNKVIKINFSEPLKWGTFWIELKNSTGTVIPITKSITGNVLTITHSALLAANTKYTIAMHSGCVTDYAGNPLVGVVKSFNTQNT